MVISDEGQMIGAGTLADCKCCDVHSNSVAAGMGQICTPNELYVEWMSFPGLTTTVRKIHEVFSTSCYIVDKC